MSHIQPSLTFIFLRWDRSNEFAGPSISNEHRNNAENKCKDFRVLIQIINGFLTRGSIVYGRGDSMNGTPTASLQRLCAIDRVKLKVTKSSVKS